MPTRHSTAPTSWQRRSRRRNAGSVLTRTYTHCSSHLREASSPSSQRCAFTSLLSVLSPFFRFVTVMQLTGRWAVANWRSGVSCASSTISCASSIEKISQNFCTVNGLAELEAPIRHPPTTGSPLLLPAPTLVSVSSRPASRCLICDHCCLSSHRRYFCWFVNYLAA